MSKKKHDDPQEPITVVRRTVTTTTIEINREVVIAAIINYLRKADVIGETIPMNVSVSFAVDEYDGGIESATVMFEETQS